VYRAWKQVCRGSRAWKQVYRAWKHLEQFKIVHDPLPGWQKGRFSFHWGFMSLVCLITKHEGVLSGGGVFIFESFNMICIHMSTLLSV
jgi:hypothetical protein